MKALRIALGLLLVAGSLGSCVKLKYDTPPDTSTYDPKLPVNLTIAQLNNIALSMSSGSFRTMGDSTIYGIVTADDKSGNFYKQIVIQDNTGGITIGIAVTNLYADYPIGRKVYVKLNGLTIVNYKSLPEVVFSAVAANGGTTLTGIPSSVMPTTVVKASFPNTVTPTPVTMADLFQNTNKYLGMLVVLQDMEFDSTVVGTTYASPSLIAIGTARTVHDCPVTAQMAVYNSGYATFQPVVIPGGKGSLTGIFSIYNSFQFLIRDTSDVKFTGERLCR